MKATLVIAASLGLALSAALGGPALAGAPSVSPGTDVAPGVEKTRLQAWPRAAWCEGAKCWLVVWREGDLTEQETDIWCARVGADGKTIDAAGIRVCGAKGVQDRPVVASDGKGFLVAWNDLRSGKDWDVYAARVSGEGKVLAADGVPVAGGAHNQCMPTAVFAGGNWLLAWQGWVENGVQDGFGCYDIRGARVSPDGKVLDAEGKKLVDVAAAQPTLVAGGDGTALLAWYGCTKPRYKSAGRMDSNPGLAKIDASAVAPQGSAAYLALEKSTIGIDGNSVAPGVVWTSGKGGLMTVCGYKGGTTVYGFDASGHTAGGCQKFHNYTQFDLIVATSLASDGERVLFTQDWAQKEGKGKPQVGVFGWVLAPDGKVLEGGETGFPIAVEEGKDQIQGFACAGPAETFLVVYAEARGVEKTKVAARIVK